MTLEKASYCYKKSVGTFPIPPKTVKERADRPDVPPPSPGRLIRGYPSAPYRGTFSPRPPICLALRPYHGKTRDASGVSLPSASSWDSGREDGDAALVRYLPTTGRRSRRYPWPGVFFFWFRLFSARPAGPSPAGLLPGRSSSGVREGFFFIFDNGYHARSVPRRLRHLERRHLREQGCPAAPAARPEAGRRRLHRLHPAPAGRTRCRLQPPGRILAEAELESGPFLLTKRGSHALPLFPLFGSPLPRRRRKGPIRPTLARCNRTLFPQAAMAGAACSFFFHPSVRRRVADISTASRRSPGKNRSTDASAPPPSGPCHFPDSRKGTPGRISPPLFFFLAAAPPGPGGASVRCFFRVLMAWTGRFGRR